MHFPVLSEQMSCIKYLIFNKQVINKHFAHVCNDRITINVIEIKYICYVEKKHKNRVSKKN